MKNSERAARVRGYANERIPETSPLSRITLEDAERTLLWLDDVLPGWDETFSGGDFMHWPCYEYVIGPALTQRCPHRLKKTWPVMEIDLDTARRETFKPAAAPIAPAPAPVAAAQKRSTFGAFSVVCLLILIGFIAVIVTDKPPKASPEEAAHGRKPDLGPGFLPSAVKREIQQKLRDPESFSLQGVGEPRAVEYNGQKCWRFPIAFGSKNGFGGYNEMAAECWMRDDNILHVNVVGP